MRATSKSLVTSSLLTLLVVSGCGTADDDAQTPPAEAFSGQTVRIIVPTSAGGGFDTTARQLQPYLAAELDANVIVENMDGGGTAIGVNAALNTDQDCLTVLFHGIPHLQFSYLTQEVDYDLSDFTSVSGISAEPAVIRVRNDAPWESLQDLIDDALDRPGEITFSTSGTTSNNHLGLLRLEEATGADFNLVAYDGGGPARTALIAGEVDATHAGMFGSLSIDDETRVLAVQQDENNFPDVTDDAPTVNDALDITVSPSGSNYGLIVPAGCSTEYPDRYDFLVESVQAALGQQGYLDSLEELGELEKLDVRTPEDYTALSEETEQDIREVIASYPDVYTGG